MSTRRQTLRHLALLCASPAVAATPNSRGPKRIGILSEGSPPQGGLYWETGFWALMGRRNWVLGENVVVERAFANWNSDRLAALAEELVRKKVDVILCNGDQEAVVAASRATRTIPIIFFDAFDPVEVSLIDSFSRPGRNLTGISFNSGPDFAVKRLEFLSPSLSFGTTTLNEIIDLALFRSAYGTTFV